MIFEALVLFSLGKPVKVPDVTGQPTIVDIDWERRVWRGRELYTFWWQRYDGEFYRWKHIEFGVKFEHELPMQEVR